MRRLGMLVVALVVGARAGGPFGTAFPASEPTPAHRIEAGPVALEVPATWLGRPRAWSVGEGAIVPSGDRTLAFLSPQPLVDPCRSEGGAARCAPWPIARLADGGLVVAVRTYGGPGRVPPAGDPTTVDGREARLVRDAGDAACRAIGGTERVRTIVPGDPGIPERPGSFGSWTEIDACLGQSAAAVDALAAILASVRWLPEE